MCLQRCDKLIGQAGLFQDRSCASCARALSELVPWIRRGDKDRNPGSRLVRLQFTERREAVEFRQANVENDHVGPLLLSQTQTFETIRCSEHLEPLNRQVLGEHVSAVLVVLDAQDATRHAAT